MPRNPRIHHIDFIYHVTSRGVEKRPIFLNDRDRHVFLDYLREFSDEAGASLLAYCLMGNHFHLLVAVRETTLSCIMHRLLTRYAVYFNHAYERVGHLFQGRYWAECCENLGYLIHLAVYIHRNPVRAGMTVNVSEWPWSSHHEFVTGQGRMLDLSRLEEIVELSPDELRERYLERVHIVATSTDLDEVVRRTAADHQVDVSALLAGHKGDAFTQVKSKLVAWAQNHRITDEDLARALHCTSSAIRQIRRRSCHKSA